MVKSDGFLLYTQHSPNFLEPFCDREHDGRRQRGQKRLCPLWIFMHDTDKVEGGLMVLFFGLVIFR